jgi:uncharacterized membrane protein HdeD (DUF308 family)
MQVNKMARQNKWNPLQFFGLVMSIIGLLFVAFPGTVGTISIRMITFLFFVMAVIGLSISLAIRSKASIVLSVSVLLMSLYTFANPDYLLLIIGLGFILNGINGLFLFFIKSKQVGDSAVITSLLFILLGVFAFLNAQAALSTIVLIFGMLMTVFGIVLFISGKSFKAFRSFESSGFTAYHTKPSNGRRIVIDIQSDDAEEVDFREVK